MVEGEDAVVNLCTRAHKHIPTQFHNKKGSDMNGTRILIDLIKMDTRSSCCQFTIPSVIVMKIDSLEGKSIRMIKKSFSL
jgi:hypothetical protein